MVPAVVDDPRQPSPSCESNARRPHCAMGELKHRHLMNKHKPRKKIPIAQFVLFDAGFNSGVVNKAQCEVELSAPLERFFNFKFR